MLHIHHHERPRYPITWNNDVINENLRVKWSLGDYTEEEFKVLLQRNEKKNMVKKEIGLVLEMIVNSTTDIFQKLVFENNSNEGREKSLLDLEKIRIMANENLELISKDFSVKTPTLNEEWIYN